MRVLAAVRARAAIPTAAASLAEALKLSPYDVALRLGGELPRVLAMLPSAKQSPVDLTPFRGAYEEDPALRLQRACIAAGVDAVLFDEADITDDARRLRARGLALRDDALVVHGGYRGEVVVPWSSLRLVLRAMQRRVEPRRAPTHGPHSAARAIFEMRVLPNRARHGEPPAELEPTMFLYAQGQSPIALGLDLDFGFLGEAMRATRFENLQTVQELLRQKAIRALFDDRLLRMGARERVLGEGFGLRLSGRAQLDLAAHALDVASREGMLGAPDG